MPVNWTIDKEHNLIDIRLTDTVQEDELVKFYRGLGIHADYNDNLAELWDMTGLRDIGFSLMKAPRVSKAYYDARGKALPIRMAVVFTSPYQYALIRQTISLSENELIADSFKSREEAIAWLMSLTV